MGTGGVFQSYDFKLNSAQVRKTLCLTEVLHNLRITETDDGTSFGLKSRTWLRYHMKLAKGPRYLCVAWTQLIKYSGKEK